jgi:hypothetical protein
MHHDRLIVPLGGIVACGLALCLALAGWVVLSAPGPHTPAPAVQDSPEAARIAAEVAAFRSEFEQTLAAARRAGAQSFFGEWRAISPGLGATFLAALYAEGERTPALVPVVAWLRTLQLDAEPQVAASVLLLYAKRLDGTGQAP